jgi:hypothetical protein
MRSRGREPSSPDGEIDYGATGRRTPVAFGGYDQSLLRNTGVHAMRRSLITSTVALLAFAAAPFALAQGQQQLPPLTPPPPAPIKPYKAVAATPPQPYSDPTFGAFRKQMADIAAKKDRAALAKLVVAQGFFWIQDKDLANKSKPGIDNLAKAIGLDEKDGSGWDAVGSFANDPTASDLPEHKGVVCSPADPNIDSKAFQALADSTQTDPSEWGYPLKDGIEVHAALAANSPVVDKLGLNLVRVLADTAPPSDAAQPQFLHVATPSGKSGYIPIDSISPLGGDEMCYTKDASGWKIAGYFGGASQ